MSNKLAQMIAQASQKYYTDGSSELTDEQFDDAIEQLKQEDPDNPVLHNVGWGYDVKADNSGSKFVHLYEEVGSLEKCRTFKELKTSLKNIPVWASLKLDGISVVLYYENGQLAQALTRGDGKVGIDITLKVLAIDSSLLHTTMCEGQFTGAVRGEIVMPYAAFEQFSAIHPEAKNPRNSTAGLINGLSITEDFKFLDIVVYTITGCKVPPYATLDICSMYDGLACAFRHVVPHCKTTLVADNFDHTMQELKSDWYGKYPADGIVITSDIILETDKVGNISYDAQAFKFKAETGVSRVIDIEWNLTKTRYLMPKIHVDAIQLSGTNVQYATGYNAKYILDNGIGPGAEVELEKRGEIIPNVNRVAKSVKPDIPTHCPMCNSELVWNGVHLQCKNDGCQNADIQDILIWMEEIAPKDGLGDTLKLKYLYQLQDRGLIKDVTIDDVMSLHSYIDTISPISDHIKEREFLDMLKELFKCKIPVVQALKALNIPRLGEKTCTKLASDNGKYVKELFKWAYPVDNSYTFEDCVHTKTMLESVIGVANTQSVLENIWKFKRLGHIVNRIEWVSEETTAHTVAKGKVAITGKLSVSRKDFERELKAAGWTVSAISKDTHYLITDDPNSSSSKNVFADTHGINKVSEAVFRAMFL